MANHNHINVLASPPIGGVRGGFITLKVNLFGVVQRDVRPKEQTGSFLRMQKYMSILLVV